VDQYPDYLERQEGPDGQYCDLLTRIPYDRQRTLELWLSRARSKNDQMDAALHALLWTDYAPAKGKHVLTGEWTDDVGMAGAEIVEKWRERAMELYNDWFAAAMPGPKESTRTGRRTGISVKSAEASETPEPR